MLDIKNREVEPHRSGAEGVSNTVWELRDRQRRFQRCRIVPGDLLVTLPALSLRILAPRGSGDFYVAEAHIIAHLLQISSPTAGLRTCRSGGRKRENADACQTHSQSDRFRCSVAIHPLRSGLSFKHRLHQERHCGPGFVARMEVNLAVL